jgi:plasmid stability protein
LLAVATITIRDLDPGLKARLRLRAAGHGRSMEEEVRVILRSVLAAREGSARGLAGAIRQRFAEVGGVDIELPPREAMRTPPRPR